MIATGVALLAAPEARPDSPRARAVALHADGLDRMARGDERGALERFESALESDPAYAPALFDGIALGLYEPSALESLRSIRDSVGHPLRRCADALIAYHVGSAGHHPPAAAERTVCDRFHTLILRYATLEPRERARRAVEILSEFPASVFLFRILRGEVEASDTTAAWTITHANRARSEFHALLGLSTEANVLHRRGRHADAVRRERELKRRASSSVASYLAVLELSRHASFPKVALPAELLGHFDSAARSHVDAVAAWRSIPVASLRFEVGRSWATMLLNDGRLSEALTEAEALRLLADSLGSAFAGAEVALLHGRAAVKAGQTALAEQRLLEARMLARRDEVVRIEWEVSHNLLHLYESTGRDSLALAAGLDFAAVTRSVPLRAERMMSYHDLAVHLRERGRWADAQAWFEQMVQVVDSLGQGHADFFAGEYFESIGQLERALAYYGGRARSEEPARTLPALMRVSELLGDTSGALRYAEEHDALIYKPNPEARPLVPGLLARLGRWDEAATRLQDARRDAMRRAQQAAWGRLTMELADVELSRRHSRVAMQLVDSALAVLDGPPEREYAARAIGIGALAAARARHADASERLEQLVRTRRQVAETGGAALAADLALIEGDVLSTRGDTAGALHAYELAQAGVDSLARSLAGDAARTALLATQRRVSTRALQIVLARAGRADAISIWRTWSDRRKARTMDGSRARGPDRVPRPPDDRVILDYVLLDSTVAVLLKGQGRAAIHDLRVQPAEVARRLDRLYALAAPRVGSVIDAARARLDDGTLLWLSSALLGPLLGEIGSARRIEFVPDGFLHLVPFDVLPLGGEDGLVLHRFVTSLAPSLRMAGSASRPRDARPAAVVAGPARGSVAAPGAQEEAHRVRNAVTRRRVRLLMGDDATETTVRGAIQGAGIVHLAAHATPNGARPDLAEVRLTADSGSDGRLQAFEIRTLDFRAATIVLSACETGAGPVAGGEGPISLARAFLQAGAGEVVATMWPVRESAADLMTEFHSLLDSGQEPAVALRNAKLALLRTGADPLTIAPWLLVAGGR